MPQFKKHFTLAEANALIPWLRSIFQKTHRILEAAETERGSGPLNLDALQDRADRSRPLIPPDAPWIALSTADKIALINALMNALQERGIVIQDVRRGLIDFPGFRGDDEILLCYELADGAKITHWHGLHTGFAGRQPLDELIE